MHAFNMYDTEHTYILSVSQRKIEIPKPSRLQNRKNNALVNISSTHDEKKQKFQKQYHLILICIPFSIYLFSFPLYFLDTVAADFYLLNEQQIKYI